MVPLHSTTTTSSFSARFYPPSRLAPPLFLLPRETSRRRAFSSLNRGFSFTWSCRRSLLLADCGDSTRRVSVFSCCAGRRRCYSLGGGAVVRFPSMNARLLVVIAEVQTRWCGCEGCGYHGVVVVVVVWLALRGGREGGVAGRPWRR